MSHGNQINGQYIAPKYFQIKRFFLSKYIDWYFLMMCLIKISIMTNNFTLFCDRNNISHLD